jgi:hypothetical protein
MYHLGSFVRLRSFLPDEERERHTIQPVGEEVIPLVRASM